MISILTKRLLTLMGIIGLIGILALELFTSGAGASVKPGPSTPARSPSQTSTLFSVQGPASWITHPTNLDGKAIHFDEIYSAYIEGSHSLADGRTVRGDVWELINSEGQVVAFHGIYTSINGKTLYEQVYQNTTANAIILTRNMPGIPPSWFIDDQCVLQSHVSASTLSSSLLPMFVSEAAIKADGFHLSVGSIAQPPVVTPSLSNVHPTGIYSASGPIQIWTKMTRQGAVTNMQQEEVDAHQRALVMSGKLVDKAGKIINSTWTAFSLLYLYVPSQVPPSFFTVPQHLPGGCL